MLRCFIFLMSFFATLAVASDYSDRADVQEFIKNTAKQTKLEPQYIADIIGLGVKQQSILDAIARPAEKVLTWGDYRRIFLEPTRLQQGVQFWRENRVLVEQLADKYQVAPEIILAIIGVETRYGKVTGNYRVIDALTTLAFDYPPRAAFFRQQLVEFLLLLKEQRFDATQLKGSYAGAMGYGQFISSSYRQFALDGDGDGAIDILRNKADAVASVANYFKQHGWNNQQLVAIRLPKQQVAESLLSAMPQPEKPKNTVAFYRQKGVVIPTAIANEQKATLMKLVTNDGEEYWLGFENFYVISRYNHSHLYSMAALQLSQLLRLHVDMP